MGTVHPLRGSGGARRGARVGQVISYTLNDVKAIRLDIVRQTTELGNAAASCSPPLDDATSQEWRSLRNRVADTLRDEPSWFRADSQYRKLEALQKDLLPWYDRLRDRCSKGLPPTPTPPTKPLISPAGFAGVSFEGLGPVLLVVAVLYFMKKNGNGRRR